MGKVKCMDPYVVLGVTPIAPQAELERAYRARLALLHPDRTSCLSAAEREAAEAMMTDLQQAWALVGDERARARYDGERRSEDGAQAAQARAQPQAQAQSEPQTTQGAQARPDGGRQAAWGGEGAGYDPWTDFGTPRVVPDPPGRQQRPPQHPLAPEWRPGYVPPYTSPTRRPYAPGGLSQGRGWSPAKTVVALVTAWILLGPLSGMVGHGATLWLLLILLGVTVAVIVRARWERHRL